jgi:GT2 family glycosyltransferase
VADFSVLIVNYNSWAVLAPGLDSIHAHPPRGADGEPLDYEIIVVDNDSPSKPEAEIAAVRERLREGRDRLILHDENGGYSKGMNLAYEHCSGEFVLVSNPDVLYQPECLHRLVEVLREQHDVGATAPVTFADPGLEARLPTGIVPRLIDRPLLALAAVSRRFVRWYSRVRTPRYVPIFRPGGDMDLEMFAGWGFAIRRDVIDKVGFFDERYPLYYEDTDLSLRVLEGGFRIVQVEDAHLVHLYNQSGKTAPDIVQQRHDASERLFFRRWKGLWGQWVVDLSRAFLRTKFAKGRVGTQRHGVLLPADTREDGVVEIRLPEPCDDFLVEIAFDPYFMLCAGTFGSGDRWSPGPAMAYAIAQQPTYFRLVDLTNDRMAELGQWCLTPPT